MLGIRQIQMDALQNASRGAFEKRMLVHLSRYFPEANAAKKEVGARELIGYGIERAGHYGIVAERDVCKYIDVMVVLGRDFDTDTRFPWAAKILTDDTITDNKKRVASLVQAVTAHTQASEAQDVR